LPPAAACDTLALPWPLKAKEFRMLKAGLPFLLVPLALLAMGASGTQTLPPEEGDSGRLICKTTMITGSLAKKRRTCGSRKAWDRYTDAIRKHGELMISAQDSCGNRGNGGTCPVP